MNVLITGGAGFLGQHLIAALQSRGDKVRVLDRTSEHTRRLARAAVAFYPGDVRQSTALTEPMQGADAVFHLAAMQAVWRPLREYQEVNVSGTANVCRAVLDAGVSRLIHISSWTVYGMGRKAPAHEDSPLRPLNEPYSVSKTSGDRLVQRMIAEQGLPAVIIRPDTIFGPGDRVHVGRIADRLRADKGVIVGSGRNPMPFVYVDDVVKGLLLALDRSEAVGRAYNIASDQVITQEELLGTIADEVGAKRPRIHVPYAALYGAAYAAEKLALVTASSRAPMLTRLGVAIFGADNRHAIDRARRELGYSPRVALTEGLRRAAAWYREEHAGRVLAVRPASG